MEQRFIGAGQFREHRGVLPITLAIILIDRSNLARIRDQNPVAEFLEISADPGTLHPDLHHHERSGVLLREPGE